MSELICRKTMMRCNTPGTCSPHGGCRDDRDAALAARDARIAELEAEVQRLDAGWHEANKQVLEQKLASQQQAEPLIDTSAWQSCNPGCDPEFNGEKSRHCSCEPAKAAIAAQQQAEPTGEEIALVAATPSEDGRDVVGYLDHERKAFSPVETDDHRCPLIYLANFERIVAAKDAEIARLNESVERHLSQKLEAYRKHDALVLELRAQHARQVGDWPKLDKPAKVGCVRFRAGVSAQLVVEAAQRQYEYDVTPEKEAERIAKAAGFLGSLQYARQVGGDEREPSACLIRERTKHARWNEQSQCMSEWTEWEPTTLKHGRSITDPKRNTPEVWQMIPLYTSAALAPAAVVMPEYERDERTGLIIESTRNAWNDCLDAVARLNRRAIPVGLLDELLNLAQIYKERLEEDDAEPEDVVIAEQAIDELRALLGKEGER